MNCYSENEEVIISVHFEFLTTKRRGLGKQGTKFIL